MNRRALVVGAGIGGLSAGIALRQAGWTVQIFERAASPRELGFGLGLAPNAIAALRDLGVADVVLAQSAVPRRGELRRPDGTVIKRLELPPGALGGPLVLALRPALHGALLQAVGLDTVTFSAAVTGFSLTNDRVLLDIRHGSAMLVAEGDLLVGADGIGSVIRHTLHPAEPPPRSSGIAAVRGAVHGVLSYLGDNDAIYYVGCGVESMFVRASQTGIYWYVSLARQLLLESERDPVSVLKRVSPQFDSTFQAITSATSDLRYDELMDRDPIPVWGEGPVTLLGDAAHPLLPHTGQGAAQAIVDAVALGRAVSGGDPFVPSIRRYEIERRKKTTVLLAQGRRTARVMRMTNPVACYLRELAVRLMPIQQFVRIYVSINRRAGTDVRQ